MHYYAYGLLVSFILSPDTWHTFGTHSVTQARNHIIATERKKLLLMHILRSNNINRQGDLMYATEIPLRSTAPPNTLAALDCPERGTQNYFVL